MQDKPAVSMMKQSLFVVMIASVASFVSIRAEDASEIVPLTRTDAEWKQQLTDQEYRVLRQDGTERAFTSELLNEKRDGVFTCAGCELPLFSSITKYKSGSRWRKAKFHRRSRRLPGKISSIDP